MLSSLKLAAILLWLLLAIAVPLVLLIIYGMRVFTGLPWVDDWMFLDKLRGFMLGDLGFDYVLGRHNGHPSVSAHLAFLTSFYIAGLDLGFVRWSSAFIQTISALVVAMMFVFQARGNTSTKSLLDTLTHPAIVLCIPISVALFLSLGHWETYSLAMAITNFSTLLFVIVSLACVHFWRTGGMPVLLVVAFVGGVGAMLSMSQGLLVWPSIAAMLVVAPLRKSTIILLVVLIMGFIASVIWHVASTGSPATTNIHLSSVVASILVLLGTSLFGHIGNQPIVSLDMAVGAIVALLLVCAFASYMRSPAETRAKSGFFFGLFVYGIGTVVMIGIGRQSFSLEAYGASRYAGLVLPVIVGAMGMLSNRDARPGLHREVLAGLLTLSLAGWLVTNFEEARMSVFRQEILKTLVDKLQHDPDLLNNDERLRAELYLDEYYAAAARRVVPWLRQNELSVYREER